MNAGRHPGNGIVVCPVRRTVVSVRSPRWVVVAALAALCVGCSGSESDSDSGLPGTGVVPARADAPAGWHTESWHGVEVEVPDSWHAGSRVSWCANDGSADRPVVERPDQPRRDIRCRQPVESLGLTFGSAASFDPAVPSGSVWRYAKGEVEFYLDGSWLGLWYDRQRVVQVNASDRPTAERVLSSLRLADDDGCPSGIYANTDFALDGDDGGRLQVCRFVAAGDPQDRAADVLADARELTADQSRAVRAALAHAPEIKKSEFRRCRAGEDGDEREFYLVSTPHQVAFWLDNSACGEHGVLTVDDHGKSVDRAVTAELLDALGSPLGPLRD